jgi:hypothetical protein
MSTTRGIFESFSSSAKSSDSPFAIAPEAAGDSASPFTAVARQDSPFKVDEAAATPPVEPGSPAKLPERRKVDSPFQVADSKDAFGFEAPTKAFGAAPLEAAPLATSPFSAEPKPGPSTSTKAAIAAFGNWQEPAAPVTQEPSAARTATPAAFAEADPFSAPVQIPSAFGTQAPAREAAAPIDDSQSDSYSIRQLELRAIFGVDREMNAEEILQRTRALPGVRNLARVSSKDMGTIEALKQLLPNLGFGSGILKLYAGSVPLEFIREGPVVLAVQTDGGFAPGVRETLIIVARELGRLP